MKILQILILLFSVAILANAQTAVLTGSVYDANGALIIGSRVTAVNRKGQKFEAVTNSEGVYALNLPFNLRDGKESKDFKISKYDIVVDSTERGFENLL